MKYNSKLFLQSQQKSNLVMKQSFEDIINLHYCDIMRFTVLHNRHRKVSQSVLFFMHCKTLTILLRIRARGHSVMSIIKNHESHYTPITIGIIYYDLGSWCL